MEHSQLPTAQILEKLTTSLSNDDDVRDVLPILISCFERAEDAPVLPEAIAVLLGPTVQALPLQDVEETVLRPFLPLVKQFLFKILSSIQSQLEVDTPEDSLIPEITKNLEMCIQILTDVENLLSYFISLSNVTVANVFSIPRNIADVVNQVFVHCRNSKTEYQEIFPAVRSDLMNLFQKCHKVQVNLFKLLNEKLTFDCSFENELQLLVDVLFILNTMAEVVADLDTLSLVAHWKAYTQITQTYASHLSSRLPIDRPINYLAVNINHQLSNINFYVDSEKKIILRSLKISRLHLKVLIKLCENYKGYLKGCHKELLNCLISLSANSSQCLSQQGVAPDIAAQITTHLCAGAAPLLSPLLADPGFFKVYLQHADKLDTETPTAQVGYCQLTNLILKKVIQLSLKDDEARDIWVTPSLPLVETVFKLLHLFSSSGEVVTVHEDDLYQALLAHTTAFFVTTCDGDMFPHLESLLVSQLLQPALWPALFSSDLFCLIARFGSSELCEQLCSLLNDILSCWPACDRQRPEWVYVSWTHGRLVPLLSSSHLQVFSLRLPSIPKLAADIASLLAAPFPDGTIQLFQSVIERLTTVSDNMTLLPESDHKHLVEAMYQLWQCAVVPTEAIATETSHWFFGFFSLLISVTSSLVKHFNDYQIGHIIDVLTKTSNTSTSLFHHGACEILRSLATKEFTCDSSKSLVCQRISLLFVQLMQHENPVLKQVALETFSYFAYVTNYEEIVAETVANDSRLQVEITNYLEGVPTVHSDKSFTKHMKDLHTNFLHKCSVVKCKLVKQALEEEESNPCKKLKTSLSEGNINIALQRMKKDVDLIEQYCCSSVLSQSELSCLNNIVSRLGEIVKTS